MALLEQAHAAVGGPIRSAGGTGSWDLNVSATELQAGSYALMDTDYASLGLPFGPALSILATVISVNQGGWAVADCGLKALGMDHGNPSLADGSVVWFCSDEHITSRRRRGVRCPPWATWSGSFPPTSTRPWPITSGCTWWRTTACWRRGRWTCGAGEAGSADFRVGSLSGYCVAEMRVRFSYPVGRFSWSRRGRSARSWASRSPASANLLDYAVIAQCLEALKWRGVLLFRGLNLTDEAQVEFSRTLGELVVPRRPGDLQGQPRPDREPGGRVPQGHLPLAYGRRDRPGPAEGEHADRPARGHGRRPDRVRQHLRRLREPG